MSSLRHLASPAALALHQTSTIGSARAASASKKGTHSLRKVLISTIATFGMFLPFWLSAQRKVSCLSWFVGFGSWFSRRVRQHGQLQVRKRGKSHWRYGGSICCRCCTLHRFPQLAPQVLVNVYPCSECEYATAPTALCPASLSLSVRLSVSLVLSVRLISICLWARPKKWCSEI